jgi:hypothetical protein
VVACQRTRLSTDLSTRVRPRVNGGLAATGSYLGEGFDAPSLEILFLAFPLAFKGRVVQYIGLGLRTTDIKTYIEVHNYLDPDQCSAISTPNA